MDCLVSYLPLSHIAGQLADIICPALAGSCIWFAQPDALKGTLKETIAVSPIYSLLLLHLHLIDTFYFNEIILI